MCFAEKKSAKYLKIMQKIANLLKRTILIFYCKSGKSKKNVKYEYVTLIIHEGRAGG